VDSLGGEKRVHLDTEKRVHPDTLFDAHHINTERVRENNNREPEPPPSTEPSAEGRAGAVVVGDLVFEGGGAQNAASAWRRRWHEATGLEWTGADPQIMRLLTAYSEAQLAYALSVSSHALLSGGVERPQAHFMGVLRRTPASPLSASVGGSHGPVRPASSAQTANIHYRHHQPVERPTDVAPMPANVRAQMRALFDDDQEEHR